jgi:hypothetical protein
MRQEQPAANRQSQLPNRGLNQEIIFATSNVSLMPKTENGKLRVVGA